MKDIIYSDIIPSSFVKKAIKRPYETGHGEAKLYLTKDYSSNNYLKFFNNYSPSNKYFFDKCDLLKYMNDPRIKQHFFCMNLKEYWNYHIESLKNFETIIEFTLEERIDTDQQSRYYIRSWDDIFREFFRSVALPDLTYIKIKKFSLPNYTNMYYKFKLEIIDY